MSIIEKHIDLSIVIVNYKTPQLLLNCIESIQKETYETVFEIIVVDNFSEDNSKELIQKNFANIHWIEMKYNSGFSRGNNVGIKASSGKYILLLNSDTIIMERAIDKSMQFYQNFEQKEKAGILSCQMVDLNGNILFNSNLRFPGIRNLLKSNPFILKYGSKNQQQEQIEARHSKNHESLWLGVAFALFNSDLCKLENIWFDEDFFLYSEDVEWCYRIHKRGYKNYFFAGASIIHIDSGSSLINEVKISQITISGWLCIRKTKGAIFYTIFIAILRLNLFLDALLFFKNKIVHKLNSLDYESLESRKFLLLLLKKYSRKILFSYKRKTSYTKEFLKYGS